MTENVKEPLPRYCGVCGAERKAGRCPDDGRHKRVVSDPRDAGRLPKPKPRGKRDPKRGRLPTPERATARQKAPIVNRALRDLRLVEWNADGIPLSEIARRDGRTRRTIEGILEAHREHGIIGGASLMRRDPVTVMKRMLDRSELHYQLAFEAAMEAGPINQKIAALRTMIEAQERLIELSQHLGILPRTLGTFRHVIDLRQIGERMVEMVGGLERGERTAAEVGAFFRELAEYGVPEGIPESVDGTTAEEAA